MNAVTVNNRTYTDDSNPVTGLGNGGHRTRLIPLFSDALTEIADQVLTASQSYRATSTSAVSIGSGSQDFLIAAGKGFAVGDLVLARDSANAANFMVGAITAFNSVTGDLTLSVAPGDFGGSGLIAEWMIMGPIGPRGLRGLAGYSYRWDVSTAAEDPRAGLMRANNAALASATAFYLDNSDGLGVDLAAQLANWDASSSAVKGRLILRSQTDPSQQISYDVTAVASSAGHVTLTVVYRGGAASFAAGIAVDVAFSRTGDKGDVANPGQQFEFDTATAAGDPGSGRIRFNSAALGSATAAYIDPVDASGADVSAWLMALGEGTSQQKGVLRVQSMTALSKFAEFGVSAAVDSTVYHTVTLSYLGPTPAPVFAAGEALSLLWSRAGDRGDKGDAGSITNAGDGTETAPGFAFSAETSLGIRRKGPALAAVTGGGADLLELRPATLVEAVEGTNTLAVMTPQRVADAITALALPAQSGQAGKVLRTNGSAAGWAFQTGAGGAFVSGSVVLTATSAAAQAVTPTGLGQAVTLPNATTLGPGAQLYQISNLSAKFQLGIRDAAGKLIEVIAPGGVCDLGLIDVSTSAGQWTANNSAPESVLIKTTAARALAFASDPNASRAQLGGVILMVVGADSSFSTGVYLQAFDTATGVLGTPVLVSVTARTGCVTMLSATKALCVVVTPTGNLSAVVATISGDVVSLGTLANTPVDTLFLSSVTVSIAELQSLSDSLAIGLFLSIRGGPTHYYSALAFRIVGSTVYIGEVRYELVVGSANVSSQSRQLGASIVVLGPATFLLLYCKPLANPTSSVCAEILTVLAQTSGSPLHRLSFATFTYDSTNPYVFLRQLTTGKYVAGYSVSNVFTACVFSVTGTTVTMGPAFNTGMNIASSNYVMQAFTYDATRLFYFGTGGYGVLRETAGTLSHAAGPYPPANPSYVTQPLNTAIGLVDGYIYFRQSQTAARAFYDGAATVTFESAQFPPRNGQVPSDLFGKIGTTPLFSNLISFKGRSLVGVGSPQISEIPTALTVLSGVNILFSTRSPLSKAWTLSIAEVAQ